MSKQTNELKNMMASFFQMNTASSSGSGPLPNNTIANPKGELKSITTRSGLVLDGPFFLMPPSFINPGEDERAEETLTDPKLAEYTIKVPPPLVQKAKPHSLRNYVMLKALLSNKEKLLKLANTPLNENCSAVILKKLPKKLGDPGKFLIQCGFSELKCKALSDLAGIARDVFVPVKKFTFPANFVIVDYESDPRAPLILGRHFLRTARALIDVHGEEMILRDGDERLTLNMRHDTSSYSNQPHKESINMIDIYNDSYEDYLKDLFATNHLSGNPTFSSHTDLTSPEVINPLSSNTTSSSPDHLLEEFTDELALITFPPGNDDLLFNIESDLREIEYLLNHDPTKEMDYIIEDSVDEGNLTDSNNDLVDTLPEMFTDKHTLDYSSLPLYDDVDDDLVELESDNNDVYDDPFDTKEDKIKESKLLIDELDPSRSSDFLPSPEYDSDFNPPLYELPFHKEVPGSETLLSFSSDNEEKVFNPGILTSKGVHTSLLPELSHRGPKAFKVIKNFESPMEIFPCSYG
nr:reverse transcriptase domain-containing protein [Tanacetum cinerariifolium]